MEKTQQLGTGRIAAFSLPILFFQAIGVAWRVYLPAFMVGAVGLSLGAAGAVIMVVRILDAVVDPLIGWIGDRSGRRKPWMIAGVPLVIVGALSLCLAPPGAGFLVMLAASLALNLGYTLIINPYGAWGLELGRDSGERTALAGARIWFASAGMILVLLSMGVLERRFGFDRTALVAVLGVMIAVVTPLTVGLVLLLFTERPSPRKPLAIGVGALLGELARKPQLVAALGLYAAAGASDAAGMASFLFFVENVLGLAGWGAILMLAPTGVLLAALPAWTWLAHRIGRKRTMMTACAMDLIVAPMVLLVPAQNLVLLLPILVLRSLPSGVDYMLLTSLFADEAARDLEAGQPRAGVYQGLTHVTLKLAMGVGAAGALWAIGLSDFIAGAPPSTAAEWAIRLTHAAPPALSALVGLAVWGRGLVR